MAAFSGSLWEAKGLRTSRLDPQGAGGVCCCGSGVGGMVGELSPPGALRGGAGTVGSGRAFPRRQRPGVFAKRLLLPPFCLRLSRRALTCRVPWRLRSPGPVFCLSDVAVTVGEPFSVSGPGQDEQPLSVGEGDIWGKDDVVLLGFIPLGLYKINK